MRLLTALLSQMLGLLLIAIALIWLAIYALPAHPLAIGMLIAGLVALAAPLVWAGGLRRYAGALAGAAALIAVSLVALEVLLWLTGRQRLPEAAIAQMAIIPFECDPVCVNPPEITRLHQFDPTSPDPMMRVQLSNAMGFMTETEFDPANIPDGAFRVLASGDSFTVGFTAQMGRSYVELAQANTPGIVIWNAAFPGTNVVQHLNVLEHTAPIMQPDLLLVGLNENDMGDLALRGSQFAHVTPLNAPEQTRWVSRFSYSPNFQPVLLSDEAVGYRFYNVEGVALNPLSRALLGTRTGYLLYFTFRRFVPVLEVWDYPGAIDYATRFNRERLMQLRTEAEARGIPMLGMVIRGKWSIGNDHPQIEAWYRLIEEAGIPYLDPSDQLVIEDYRNANPTDDHWNNDGHAKAGALLTECLTYMAANDGALCPQAVVPGG